MGTLAERGRFWSESTSCHQIHAVNRIGSQKKPLLSVHDVVIDDLEELRWRLRALYAMHNTVGTKIRNRSQVGVSFFSVLREI